MTRIRRTTGQHLAIVVALMVLVQPLLALHSHAVESDTTPDSVLEDCPACALSATGADGEAPPAGAGPFVLPGTASAAAPTPRPSEAATLPAYTPQAPRAPPVSPRRP